MTLPDTLTKSLLEHVADVAERQPDALASVAERSLTYAQFVQDGRSIAGAVAARVRRGSPVALAIEDGASRCLAALGVARAGSPVLAAGSGVGPAARVRDLIDRADPALIICVEESDWLEQVAPDVPRLLLAEAVACDPNQAPNGITASDPAEIIFTSGSTGEPKIVVRNVVTAHGMVHASRELGLRAGSRVSMIDTGAIAGAWGNPGPGLLLGGQMHHLRLSDVGPAGFVTWLRDQRIQFVRGIPSYIRVALGALAEGEVLEDLDVICMGGEECRASDVDIVRRHLRPDAKIAVTYGATEARLVTWAEVTAADVAGGGIIPVGRIVPGRTLSLVDAAGAPAGMGQEGRICITGPRGNVTPDAPAGGQETVIIEDRGRMLEDGRLLLSGRTDGTLNINAQRINPVEVEAAISHLPSVLDVIVTASGDNQSVVAVIVPTPGMSPMLRDVRDHLVATLPLTMLPRQVVVLDGLPRLPGGKVDRRAVAELVAAGGAPSAPQPHEVSDIGDVRAEGPEGLAQQMAKWMSEVIGKPVRVSDDFLDLGASSLQAARLFAVIHRHLGVDMPLSLLLDGATPTHVAGYVIGELDGPGVGLVTVRPGVEELPPVFICHGAGGNILYARFIAQGMDPRRAVHAIEATYLHPERRTERTVGELAATYVELILQAQPSGPYHLVGYSFGGFVVAEMGRRLFDAGHEVGIVGLGDTSAPSTLQGNRRQAFARRAARHRGNLAQHDELLSTYVRRLGRKRLRRLASRLGRLWAKAGGNMPASLIQDEVWRNSRRLLSAFDPKPYPVPMTLFRASRSLGEPDLGWGPFAPMGLEIVHLEGMHRDLSEPALGRQWGEAIEAVIVGSDR